MSFEFVHASPEIPTTLNRMALTARRAGYSSIVVRNHSDTFSESMPVADEIGIDAYSGVEINTESVNELHGYVGKYKQMDIDFICVHGGDEAINRAAVTSENVDVLCHPQRGKGMRFNHVLAKEAASNDVAVEFNLGKVLRSSGGPRVYSLRDMKRLLTLFRKYGFPIVISADPFSHLEVRGRREIEALCSLIGLTEEEIELGMCETPRKIARKPSNGSTVEVIEK
ncbi:MAG: RNase P subunit p30 family protein [Halobacteria archaeon]|nr:RNase P subunit p30 family protein [Halobacteria archaeon]